MKLIDADLVIKALKQTKEECTNYADKVVCDYAIKLIRLVPPIYTEEKSSKEKATKIIQKAVRTTTPASDVYFDEKSIIPLKKSLEDGWTVVMCNIIERKDGEQWLEYILQKEIEET